MKKTLVLILGFFLIVSQSEVNALEIRRKIRNEIKEATLAPTILPAQIRKKIREKEGGLFNQIKNRVKEIVKRRLRFGVRLTGEITMINDNQLTVSDNEGKNYSVLVSEKTQLRRRFWGRANLSEFKVGDKVNVIGRYSDEEKTTIEAVLIRNLSIQKRWGVFFGKVISSSSNSLVIETNKRGQLTVYTTSKTRIINRQQETIDFSDIKVGHRIRVKGIWDRDLKEVREVEEIKDFSLPLLLRPTASQ